MIAEWSRPEAMRAVAPPPSSRPPDDDIAKVAADLLQARSPFILVESAGSDQETFDALVELAELLAIPVIDAPGACLSNFPKSHDLYLGLDTIPYLAEMDFALLVENEAPWYPPSNMPKKRKDRLDRKQSAQGHAGLSGHRRQPVSRRRHGAHSEPAD